MALVSGGLMYGVAALARVRIADSVRRRYHSHPEQKYLVPHLQPPSEDAFEATTSQLNAQFDEAAALLKQIQEETVAAHTAVQEQQKAVDSAVEEVKTVMEQLRKGEESSRDQMREIRSEVDNIREMLPKMMEANKEAQSHSLAELHQEIKSLKALLVTRRPESPSTSSPLLNLGRPSIPSWQLSGASESNTPSNGIAKPPFNTSIPVQVGDSSFTTEQATASEQPASG